MQMPDFQLGNPFHFLLTKEMNYYIEVAVIKT